MAHPPQQNTSKSWFSYFQYEEGRDSPSDARNVLLVVAALIAAVTFQAGVNPPGGVWQDNSGHAAGTSIYGSQKHAFYVFLIFNTLALSTSILVIISLTYRFPFHFEIGVATASMIVTYGSAIFAITPDKAVRFRYILITAAGPFVMRLFMQIFNKFKPQIFDIFDKFKGQIFKMFRKFKGLVLDEGSK